MNFLGEICEFLLNFVIARRGFATPKQSIRDLVAFLGARNAKSKIKAQNEAKRFAPKEKIWDSKSSFFRGQRRPANLEF